MRSSNYINGRTHTGIPHHPYLLTGSVRTFSPPLHSLKTDEAMHNILWSNAATTPYHPVLTFIYNFDSGELPRQVFANAWRRERCLPIVETGYGYFLCSWLLGHNVYSRTTRCTRSRRRKRGLSINWSKGLLSDISKKWLDNIPNFLFSLNVACCVINAALL